MNGEQRKQRIKDGFAALAAGDGAPLMGIFADNVQWTIIGNTRFSGTYNGLADVGERLLGPLGGLIDGHLHITVDNLIAAAGPNRMPYYYRTHAGAELDLLFEKGGRIEMAIEIKRSSSPNPAKGFAIACDDLGITQRFVVYPGTERFALRHGAEAIGLQELAGLLRA